uniref:Transposase n=1 Tax=Peronospora matthiolae TaxID=2874970 RepID=A0AAV1UPZ1_9STRA
MPTEIGKTKCGIVLPAVGNISPVVTLLPSQKPVRAKRLPSFCANEGEIFSRRPVDNTVYERNDVRNRFVHDNTNNRRLAPHARLNGLTNAWDKVLT